MQCLRNYTYVLSKTFLFHNKINLIYKRPKLPVQSIAYRFSHDAKEFEDDLEDQEEAKEYDELSNYYLGTSVGIQRVFVLQPYIKWGRNKKRNTTPELQLAEAVALVKTLPYWVIVGKKRVSLLTLQKKQLLGKGGLEILKEEIRNIGNVTAIFVSTHSLRHRQVAELEKIFHLPFYDRYSIVIHIFRLHAQSPEAKLQVALAELPYIKQKMLEIDTYSIDRFKLSKQNKFLLEQREKRLRKSLKKLKMHREVVRNQRKNIGFPSVAVVGYTNAGKTSLIKALTEDKSLQPKDQLFATLDTTAHQGVLPSSMKVLYMDTIGFIQDVPQALIEPFVVTLEDAMIADVIIHVYDASHPDIQAQVQHVQKTITPMIDESKPIINVANKCDLIDKDSIPDDGLAVSATEFTGISVLKDTVEKAVIRARGMVRTRIRVKLASAECSWVYKEMTVLNTESDPDNVEYLLMDVINTESTLNKFKKYLRSK